MLRTTLAVEQEEQKELEIAGPFYSKEQRISFRTQPLKITSLDEELFAFQISEMKELSSPVVDPYFDTHDVYEEHDEVLISDYNGNVYSSGFESLASVKKIIPLPLNRLVIHATNGIDIWDIKTHKSYAHRRSYNDMEVSAVVIGESFSLIVYLKMRSCTKVSLLQLGEDLEIKTEINLDYIGPSLFAKSFVFNNKAVILTDNGMFHVHDLPLTSNPPLHIKGIDSRHLKDFMFDMNLHVWPEFHLMGIIGIIGIQRRHSIFNIWKMDNDLKTTEIQMNIPDAIFIAENPLPDGKLVYASVNQIHVFDPVNSTSTLIFEEHEPDCQINCQIRGVSVMHDGRLGILKGEYLSLNFTLHLNNLTYLQKLWSEFLTNQLNDAYSSLLKGVKQSEYQIIPLDVAKIVNQYYLAPVAFFKPKPVIAEEKLDCDWGSSPGESPHLY